MAATFYLRWAAQNLKNHPARSLLTILGVATAVAILSAILGFYGGYKRSLARSVEQMGFHVLVTAKGCPYEAATLMLKGGQIPMYIDEQIARQVASHPEVSFVAKLFMQTAADADGRHHFLMGVEPSFLEMKPWLAIGRGRWLEDPLGDEVVLGYNVAEALDKDIGDTIELPGAPRPFAVAGLLERSGSQDDGTIFLPLLVAQKLFDKKDRLTGLGVRVKDLGRLDRFVEEIYDLPSVQVIATAQIQGTLMRLVDTMRVVMLAIGLAAAIIAAMALSNTVLMSVFERSHEFGLMRALGAGVRHLLLVVCLETAALSAAGAALGTLLVLLLEGATEALVRAWLPFAPAGELVRIDWLEQGAVVALAVAAGLACGLYPALRAARLGPLRTLGGGA